MQHEATGSARWCNRSSSCPGCRADDPLATPDPVDVDRVLAEVIDRQHHRRPGRRRSSSRTAASTEPAGARQRRTSSALAVATWWTTRSTTRPDGPRVAVAARARGDLVEIASPTRASASPAASSTASSSASTGSTRRGPAPPAAPGSACHRQARRRQPRRRGARCGARRAGVDVHPRLPPSPAPTHREEAVRDPRAGRRGRGVATATRCPTCCARRGSRSRSPPTGPDALDRVRPRRRRHRAARPDAARRARHGGVPPAPRQPPRAGDHGHRQGQRDRQGGRAGARRRRLRDQAVLPARAGRPDPRGAAPRRRAGPRARRCSRPARCGWTSSGTS